MVKYDFDTCVDRHNTDSMKWHVDEGELPMWVADMDFMVAPEIRQALIKRLEHGVYGYSMPSDAWKDAYIGWWKRRHGLEISRDELLFTIGIVPAVSSAIRKFTTPAENVLLMTPVYNHFFYSIEDNGRKVLESPLHYEDGVYSIDWERLEADMANPQTTLMILCNPQNPTGNIWDRETLARIGKLAHEHSVLVLSDEIHCDVTVPGKSYVPFASVNEECRNNCVMFMSPTKCFNIAGIKTAAVCAPNPVIRHKMKMALRADEIGGVNFLALDAAITAFNEGESWLDEAMAYIDENRRIVASYLENSIPELKLVKSEATYLLWIDCTSLGHDVNFAQYLREKTGLFVSAGSQYGKNGVDFFRLNIACPKSMIMDGLERLRRGVSSYLGEH